MLSSTDKSRGAPLASPGYETRDANTRSVFGFLLFLALGLVFTLLVSWGLFRYFSAEQASPAPASPFTGTRQLPSGPQLQVNPRQDYLKFRADQERSLESYAWEDRTAGTVRVPIERAMEVLLQKGLPVAGETSTKEADRPAANEGTKQ
jgi:hypothetical protein